MADIEYGPSGPTAIKDMDPAGTGLSAEAAAFLAANCSPFTNPRDMPTLPRVPDPRNTQPTETMFIWGHFDIPAVSASLTGGATSGEQLIATSADPLSPVPIKWATGEAVMDDFTNWSTPNRQARLYEYAGLQKMTIQMRNLAQRSKNYRVVGHGLKVWVSRNTNVSRGYIEAGQYQAAACINSMTLDPKDRQIGPTGSKTKCIDTWVNGPGMTTLGFQALAMQTSCLSLLRRSIESAKEQELGFLAADEGCTVRWTDTDEFDFNNTVDRGCLLGLTAGTPVASGTKLNWESLTRLAGSNQSDAAANVYQCMPTLNPLVGASITSYDDVRGLGTAHWQGSGTTQNYYGPPTTGSPGVTTSSGATDHYWLTVDNRSGSQQSFGSAPLVSYFTNPGLQFTKGLYADVSGLDQSQVLTVQVCWQVEYTPTNAEPWAVTNSPVDPAFDEIAAMARNSRAFPIVVKGHSFFSSLRRAFGRAIGFVGKVFADHGGTAAGLLASTGDPRLMALGAGVGALGAFGEAIKRKRAAGDMASG